MIMIEYQEGDGDQVLCYLAVLFQLHIHSSRWYGKLIMNSDVRGGS